MSTGTRSPRFALVFGLGLAVASSSAVLAGAADGAELITQPTPVEDPVMLDLVDQTFSFEPDGSFQLAYRLTGLDHDPLELIPVPDIPAPTTTTAPDDPDAPTTTAPPPPPDPVQLTVEVINYEPVTNPASIDRLIGSNPDVDVFSQVGDVVDGVAIDVRPLAERADDGTVTFTLDVDTDVENSVEDRLKFNRPGVWPIRVQLLIGDPADNRIVATAGTVVQRLAGLDDPAPPPPIDLSVVVATPEPPPHRSASGDNSDDTSDDMARDTAQNEFESAIDLAATLDAPVALEVPPALVAEAVSTPQGADDISTALDDDELLAMPLAPLDVSSAVAAGRADAYTRLVIGGVDVLTEAVPTTPTRRDVWITTDPLSTAGAQHLRDLGVRYLIFPQALYRQTVDDRLPRRDLFVHAALPDGGTIPILVVDDLAEQLTPRAADDTLAHSTSAEWAVGTLATMLVEQTRDDAARSPGESPSGAPVDRSRILSTPDLRAPDSRLLVALNSIAATTPAVRFAAASSLTGVTHAQPDGDGSVAVELPEIAGPPLQARITLIDSTAQTMASTATMLSPDDPRPAAWTAELDGLISTGYTDADVVATTSALVAEADRLRDAVVAPDPFTFTLTGREGTIETRVGNLIDEPLTVVLHLESSKVTFPDGDQTVTLRPLDETTVIVPIRARSNGTSSIDLSILTPTGEPLDDAVTLTARVTALTGLGQVLTGGFVLVLVTWWFNHWRSRRRRVEDAEEPAPEETEADEPGSDVDGDGDGDGDLDRDLDGDGAGDEVESDSL